MPELTNLVYDTGALIAAERGERRMWALHAEALHRGVLPSVPAGVLAQAWRGGPQPQLSRLLRGCTIEQLDEPHARSAGRLCAIAGTSDVVDASVVVLASARGGLVVSSDRDDIAELSQALGTSVSIIDM